LEEKFRDCVAFAAKPIPPDVVDQIIMTIRNLEDVEDVRVITQLLA
jgi:hypothetical protein